jgi:hypothetical protein
MSGSSARGGHPTVASLIALAQQAKAAHEHVAVTMDKLAERGGPDADRWRELARRSREFAEREAEHIAHWSARQGEHPGD